MTIQKIREDIISLRGAEVTIFGQPTTLNESVAEDLIDILDVLNQVEENEVDELVYEEYNPDTEEDEAIEFESVEEYVDYMEDNGLWKEQSHDNSYNWSSPVSNDIDFRTFRDMNTGDFYVKLMVHRFGDVRGNYTDYALLRYSYEEGFLYDIMEANKSIDVGEDYYVNIDILSDGMEVYTHDGEYVKTIYDLEDFQKEVEEGQVVGD